MFETDPTIGDVMEQRDTTQTVLSPSRTSKVGRAQMPPGTTDHWLWVKTNGTILG